MTVPSTARYPVKTTDVLFVLSLIASTAPCAETMAQTRLTEPADVSDVPDVMVSELNGVYHVSATFSVAQSASVIFDVLTGYEQIPRYMPDVRGRIGR